MKLESMKIQYPTILCGAWPGMIWYYGKHIYKWKSCQQFFTPLKPEKKSVLRNQLPIQATTLCQISSM